MAIKLVRHGQSHANVGEYDYTAEADSKVALTDLGHEQAREAGRIIGVDFLKTALLYRSPYIRARQTMEEVVYGASPGAVATAVYEDPRLREVDHGYSSVPHQEDLRKIHGWFFYRFKGGESPADCYDRVSTFLESLRRQQERKEKEDVVIVSHGITIRCFIMRFLHLSVEQFESMRNPPNGCVITIDKKENLKNPIFTSAKWGVEGITLRR
jgi:broad specificity phosphatase PhoE